MFLLLESGFQVGDGSTKNIHALVCSPSTSGSSPSGFLFPHWHLPASRPCWALLFSVRRPCSSQPQPSRRARAPRPRVPFPVILLRGENGAPRVTTVRTVGMRKAAPRGKQATLSPQSRQAFRLFPCRPEALRIMANAKCKMQMQMHSDARHLRLHACGPGSAEGQPPSDSSVRRRRRRSHEFPSAYAHHRVLCPKKNT